MNIEGTANLSENRTVPQKKNTDIVAKNILKQIKKVKENLEELTNNDEISIEEKAVRKKVLNERLISLNKRLVEKQLEQEKVEQSRQLEKIQKRVRSAVKNETQDKTQNSKISNITRNAILAVGQSIEEAKSINQVRVQVSDDARSLSGEIAAARTKGVDVSDMQSDLNELEGKSGELTTKVIEKYSDVNEAMKVAIEQDRTDTARISQHNDGEDKDKDTFQAEEREVPIKDTII